MRGCKETNIALFSLPDAPKLIGVCFIYEGDRSGGAVDERVQLACGRLGFYIPPTTDLIH